MQQTEAEKIITEYLKPIFGFALKRCRNVHDAEDLSQEIVYRAYRALLARDDIDDAGEVYLDGRAQRTGELLPGRGKAVGRHIHG